MHSSAHQPERATGRRHELGVVRSIAGLLDLAALQVRSDDEALRRDEHPAAEYAAVGQATSAGWTSRRAAPWASTNRTIWRRPARGPEGVHRKSRGEQDHQEHSQQDPRRVISAGRHRPPRRSCLPSGRFRPPAFRQGQRDDLLVDAGFRPGGRAFDFFGRPTLIFPGRLCLSRAPMRACCAGDFLGLPDS